LKGRDDRADGVGTVVIAEEDVALDREGLLRGEAEH